MLGHLVFGRYGVDEERESHATRSRTNWVERFLNAIRRRRR
jgi:hypothetical protein